MDRFIASYEVEDGYVGKSRPVKFSIYSSDLCKDMDESDVRELFQESMMDHYEQNISPYSSDEDDFVEWAMKRISEAADD